MAANPAVSVAGSLKRHRKRARLSQEELAKRAGLSVRAISDLERGVNRAPRNATVRLLVEALGLSPEERAAFEAMAHGDAARPAAHHDLPLQLTSFVGRERELDAVGRMLMSPEQRLITLTGPGGVGKTRLALRAAEEMADRFPDGACFVSLASLTDSETVPSAVARALEVRETVDQPLLDALESYLREKDLLLVLDNFEQVAPAGTFVAHLLTRCPKLKVLATSRIVLHVGGEHAYPVPPLAFPSGERTMSPERLDRYEAARLFVVRARAMKPDFAVTMENADAVADLIRELEGLPLAIELAAARTRLLTPRDMLSRLGDGLLAGGAQDAPARQQTLRATLDWSHGLLGEQGRTLMRRLSVFPAGCTLETVEAVCNHARDLDVLEAASSLVDGSLLLREEGSEGEVRLRMLKTIREYALSRLAQSGESEAVHGLRGAYYVEVARAGWQGLQGPQQEAWLRRLDADLDNVRAVLGRFLEQGDAEDAVDVGWGIWWFWFIRGHLAEGQQWMERALTGASAGLTRVRARIVVAAMAFAQGEHHHAAGLLDAAISAARNLEDPEALATAILARGNVSLPRGELERAASCAGEGARLFRELGNPYGAGLALLCAVHAAMARGDFERGERILQEGETLLRDSGAPFGVVAALNVRVLLAQAQGDYARTVVVLREAITLARSLGDNYSVSYGVTSLACALAMLGRGEDAARLFGAADALREATGVKNSYATSETLEERQRTMLQEQLGTSRLAALHAEGTSMSPEEAIAYALSV